MIESPGLYDRPPGGLVLDGFISNNNITQQSLTGFAISTITVDCALLRTASLMETNFAYSVHQQIEGRVIGDAQPVTRDA